MSVDNALTVEKQARTTSTDAMTDRARRRRRFSVGALLAAFTAIFLVGAGSTAAFASNLPLGPSEVYAMSKIYYSKPHYKNTNGEVTMKVTKVEFPGGNCSARVCEYDMYVGMRNQLGNDEDTNFPAVGSGAVRLKNIRNNSYNFGAGTYYFNAENEWYGAEPANWYGVAGGSWTK